MRSRRASRVASSAIRRAARPRSRRFSCRPEQAERCHDRQRDAAPQLRTTSAGDGAGDAATVDVGTRPRLEDGAHVADVDAARGRSRGGEDVGHGRRLRHGSWRKRANFLPCASGHATGNGRDSAFFGVTPPVGVRPRCARLAATPMPEAGQWWAACQPAVLQHADGSNSDRDGRVERYRPGGGAEVRGAPGRRCSRSAGTKLRSARPWPRLEPRAAACEPSWRT